ncbi:DUF1297 domain-containing protein [Candidatus Woesearchaeota archaeon]|nr:MAG: DUF1297 domain-containing protein [Candidatus Woesearchaeota archaeon]
MVRGYKIATLGSHTALQILKGAKDEGFKTIAICKEGTEEPYKSFGVADEIILVKSFKEVPKLEKELIKRKAVLIPHGSFIAHMGIDEVMNLKVPYFGNKKILEWESDRAMERKWLKAAGLKLPKIFKKASEIDRSVIVKFHGALGGKGYFIANSPRDFRRKIKGHEKDTYQIQEYIIGVPMYIHYFYSPITDELEILGFDKRYESNVDSLGRISARDQFALESIDPSYVVVGNVPVVLRESLLPEAFRMGRNVVEESKKIAPPGLFGPFCLETVVTPNQEFYVFEISARIVAGTNPYIQGSPYSQLKYKEPMSTGRRIAREIKTAIQKKKTNLIFH